MDKILHELASWIKRQERRIIIGISGHGASGKTTFANRLIQILGRNDVNYINTDPYIIGSTIRKYTSIDYEYGNVNHQSKMTACHPAAHQVLLLERDIKMVKSRLDFYSAGFQGSELISSQNNVTIIEGMSVAFTDPDLFDLKIYLYTNGETELNRRGIRDVSERGMDLQFLLQSHDERRIQYELFMHPFSENFDVVIKNSDEGFTLEKGDFTKILAT
jgi:uridine kinase